MASKSAHRLLATYNSSIDFRFCPLHSAIIFSRSSIDFSSAAIRASLGEKGKKEVCFCYNFWECTLKDTLTVKSRVVSSINTLSETRYLDLYPETTRIPELSISSSSPERVTDHFTIYPWYQISFLFQPAACVVTGARAVNLGNTVKETRQKSTVTLPMQDARSIGTERRMRTLTTEKRLGAVVFPNPSVLTVNSRRVKTYRNLVTKREQSVKLRAVVKIYVTHKSC